MREDTRAVHAGGLLQRLSGASDAQAVSAELADAKYAQALEEFQTPVVPENPFEEPTRVVDVPKKEVREARATKQTRKKIKRRSSESEEKKPRKTRRHTRARLVTYDSASDTICEFDSKTVFPVVLGRGKESNSGSFVLLNRFTQAKSISHRHGFIDYDKDNDRYLFANLGRNGSVVNNTMVNINSKPVVLTDNSIVEVAGFQMKFLLFK